VTNAGADERKGSAHAPRGSVQPGSCYPRGASRGGHEGEEGTRGDYAAKALLRRFSGGVAPREVCLEEKIEAQRQVCQGDSLPEEGPKGGELRADQGVELVAAQHA
jgi:hypothetical protein